MSPVDGTSSGRGRRTSGNRIAAKVNQHFCVVTMTSKSGSIVPPRRLSRILAIFNLGEELHEILLIGQNFRVGIVVNRTGSSTIKNDFLSSSINR